MRGNRLYRRDLLKALAALGGLAVSGCDRLSIERHTRSVLDAANGLTYRAQRLLIGADRLAPEYGEADISPVFRANGSTDPQDEAYRDLAGNQFTDWRLKVDGLVEQELSLSLEELRALPARTQITRHDCVEGWSGIGKWTGVPLSEILSRASVRPEARFVVFHCADALDDGGGFWVDPESIRYYESIDLIDAAHPQTILAYDMNDKPLTVPHGAPLRLRLERQLGYKMAKYLMRIELVRSFADLHGGRGGYWEDRGYEWYAGI
ncbi:molybdopterin oxidoreductase [Aliidongia dinghuensis]|uniref:Molybdopterin oxidoreductase n=1 Tax=Aliidongia dinghuensis TaxID=1867774 RepID=A0A8J2YW05_9PROT|nr:molybdopterin-binding protein [Aliidongia dinghuensis]GGF27814.1 molybdopterin oxidoreductase [Aliidongia dinghuensis]